MLTRRALLRGAAALLPTLLLEEGPMSTLYAFGDSFTAGLGCANPTQDGFAYVLARRLARTINNLGPGGGAILDLFYFPNITTLAPEASSLVVWLTGFSDMRIWGTDPNHLQVYREKQHILVEQMTRQGATMILGTCARELPENYANAGINSFAINGSDASALLYANLTKSIAAHWRDQGRDVRIADVNVEYDPHANFDFIHPNEAGHLQIAQCFLAAATQIERET